MMVTLPFSLAPNIVMVVLGTTIHEFARNHRGLAHRNSWMVGPSPTMTEEKVDGSVHPLHARSRR